MTSTAKRVPIPKNGVDYRGKVVLAPMVRSGELPSRLLALKYGADLVWGPETIDRALIGTTTRLNPRTSTLEFTRFPSNSSRQPNPDQKESVIYRLHPDKERGRLIFQLGSSSPALAVEAAKVVAPHVAGIDLNAGCPKPFSTAGGMGAALLRTPDILCSVLEALVKEVGERWEIGISVKIRLLETPQETEALVRRLVKTGITGLTIHCRTTPMRPRERAIREQLSMIADVCRDAGVACLMNGDVANRDQAVELAKQYGCDGGMIATAAEKNPSCFRSQAEGGPLGWREVVAEYVANAIAVENRWGNTKFLLTNMIPGREEAHKKMTQSKGYADVCQALGLLDLVEQGRRVDEVLEIKPKETKAEKKMKRMSGETGLSEREVKKIKQAIASENWTVPSAEEGASIFSDVPAQSTSALSV